MKALGRALPILALAASIALGGCGSPNPRVDLPADANVPESLRRLFGEGRIPDAIAQIQQLQAQHLQERSVFEREFERGQAEQHEYVFRMGRALFQQTIPIITHEPFGTWEGMSFQVMARRMREQREILAAGGDPPRLIEVHRRILADREREYGAPHPDVALAAANLGEALAEGGEPGAAEALLRRALAIAEAAQGADSPDVALALDRLAALRLEQGAPREAQPLYARALAIREKAGNVAPRLIAASLNNLGVVADALGDRSGAQALYAQAIARQQAPEARSEPLDEDDFGLKQDAAVILSNAGVTAWKHGAVEETLEWFGRSRSTHSLMRWLGFERMAEAQQVALMGQLSDEIEALIALEHGYLRQRAEAARLSLGGILEHKGRALESLARTMTLARRAPDRRPDARAVTIPGGGRIPIPAIAGAEATPAARAALLVELDAVRSRLASLKLTGVQGTSPEAHRGEIEALERRERALVAQITRSVDNSELQERFDAVIRETVDEATTPEAAARLRRDAAAVNALPVADRAMEMVPGYAASQVGVGVVEKVQQALPPDAALVELATYRPLDPKAEGAARWGARRYAAYVLHPTGAPRSVDLGDAAAVERTVAEFRRGLGDPRRTAVTAIARRLDAQIMQPVRALLGEARHVLISPEGVLNLIPFGALRDEADRYLVERYTFTYLTTGRDLLRAATSAPARQAPVIVADPAFGTPEPAGARGVASAASTRSLDLMQLDFEPLPGTAAEARAIRPLLPGSIVLAGDGATETAIKQLRGPRILHVASHGFFLPDQGADRPLAAGSPAPRRENPLLRSGLVLAGANRLSSGADDGILTALELAGLDLVGTRLVTLSACETGLGDVKQGEGVYGLRRALVIAGAETQLISLWKVADDATEALMTDFYRQLATGLGRSEAFRAAQLGMLAQPDSSHPFFWASFIVSGNWRPLGAD